MIINNNLIQLLFYNKSYNILIIHLKINRILKPKNMKLVKLLLLMILLFHCEWKNCIFINYFSFKCLSFFFFLLIDLSRLIKIRLYDKNLTNR